MMGKNAAFYFQKQQAESNQEIKLGEQMLASLLHVSPCINFYFLDDWTF